MDSTVYKYLSLLLIPFAIGGLYLSLAGIRHDVPDEKREYLDPLPRGLRFVWPVVNVFSYYVGERLPVDFLERCASWLRRAGLNYFMSPAQLVGLQLFSSLAMGMLVLLGEWMLGFFSASHLLLGMALGCALPLLSVRDLKLRRERAIVRSLPVYLDFLTMATQAGLNMTGAIHQAVDKGPESPLKIELKKFLRDLRAGMAKEDSFRDMDRRLEIAEISAFVTAVIQAERTGAAIGETLKIQADQRRTERFLRAEKLAMQAPVKMIFPLVAFIFPTTFIVIFYPIGIKLMEAL
jgi:tight adherence protein C